MNEIYKYGIGFWIGGAVYSFINLIMNYEHALQSNVLLYNYEIIGVSIIGFLFNIILLKRDKK